MNTQQKEDVCLRAGDKIRFETLFRFDIGPKDLECTDFEFIKQSTFWALNADDDRTILVELPRNYKLKYKFTRI